MSHIIWGSRKLRLIVKSKKLKLREEARAVFLQRKSRELVDNDELQKLWFLLEGNKSGEPVNDEAMITFTNFQKVWVIPYDSFLVSSLYDLF